MVLNLSRQTNADVVHAGEPCEWVKDKFDIWQAVQRAGSGHVGVGIPPIVLVAHDVAVTGASHRYLALLFLEYDGHTHQAVPVSSATLKKATECLNHEKCVE